MSTLEKNESEEKYLFVIEKKYTENLKNDAYGVIILFNF